MSENTKIEWCDHTFNPWIGCTKVGPGCDNCYAEADFGHRRKVVRWGAGQPRKRTAPSTWAQPIRWNDHEFVACEACGHRGTPVRVGTNGNGRMRLFIQNRTLMLILYMGEMPERSLLMQKDLNLFRML